MYRDLLGNETEQKRLELYDNKFVLRLFSNLPNISALFKSSDPLSNFLESSKKGIIYCPC